MNTTTLNTDAVTFVCTLVRRCSAIELDEAKTYLIEARLSPIARRNGFASIQDLVDKVKTTPNNALQQQVVEAMTTNETSFFRDMHPFDALRTKIIPELLIRRGTQKTLNIWSAACSTGQEAYSVAMLLRENFPQLAEWKTSILGTDLSDDVLGKARAGQYSQIEMNRGLPAALLVKYFRRDGMVWQLDSKIRAMAVFKKLNLIEAWPPIPTMDVVFLRNVLIYFAPEIKKQILDKIRRVMAPEAVLFLGAAETTMGLDASFERIQVNNSVYYRLK